MTRGEAVPLRVEPEYGQVALDMSEPTSNKPGDVLQHDELGSNLAQHARDFRPEPALVGGAEPLAGGAPGLAAEPGNDERNAPTPRAAVEGRQIVPHRRRIQRLRFHAGHESGSCVGVPLDVAYHTCTEAGAHSVIEATHS